MELTCFRVFISIHQMVEWLQLKTTPPVEIKASIDDRKIISENTFYAGTAN